ncbi:hypothetical protein [Halosolutus halophilus]|uniref:hypothetical protein n=1 Tax=Halosolutus halophilus TaxID=1552990 RepID=UPI0022351C67|nr:hypothetical protein [Halosolutus halophilus]
MSEHQPRSKTIELWIRSFAPVATEPTQERALERDVATDPVSTDEGSRESDDGISDRTRTRDGPRRRSRVVGSSPTGSNRPHVTRTTCHPRPGPSPGRSEARRGPATSADRGDDAVRSLAVGED